MSTLNEQFEKSSGDKFVDWINCSRNTQFAFKGRAGEAPDLVYENKEGKILLEITAAYYDAKHAKFLWDCVRNPDDQSDVLVSGPNFSKNLADEVIARIKTKSKKDYGQGCILLVVITPGATSYEDLNRLLSEPDIGAVPFVGIYIAGTFPNIDLDPSTGGYRVIPILEWGGNYAK